MHGVMNLTDQPRSQIDTQRGPLVIAYDGSAASRQAVVASATLMGSCPMLVVTVWEEGLAYVSPSIAPDRMAMAPMVDPAVVLDVDREMHQHAERISRAGAELARSLNAAADPLAVPDGGNIPATILRVARERQAVAIVVGSRGLSGLRARLEGSTSKRLLKHASCPVIVVHESDQGQD
jgi:nucleotide-binding universal stress UspA family protein